MIKLIANYSKRLGLPGYSSHQFSVSCETEITNVSDVAVESARLYDTLQQSVDDQIQQTGFVPDTDYGSNGNGSIKPVNRIANVAKTNGNGDGWHCSDKQRGLSHASTDRTVASEVVWKQRLFGKNLSGLHEHCGCLVFSVNAADGKGQVYLVARILWFGFE